MSDSALKEIKLESMDGLDNDLGARSPLAEDPRPPEVTPRKQSSYVPQFSATNTLIFSRMKLDLQKSSSEVPDALATVRRADNAAVEGTKTRPTQGIINTLAMAMPASSSTGQTLPITSNPSSDTWDFLNAGGKRKRDGSADMVDFTQSTVAFPWVDQPKSQPQSREQYSQQCSKCEDQTRTPEGTLVTCNRCLKSWHQRCHSPAVANAAARLSSFVCAGCGAEQQEEAVRLKGKVSHQRQGEIERLRQRRLATLPQGVTPAKSELVGFGAGRAPDSARTEYFSDMKKTDLLNILSLCDQLKPQLLADVLVSVSKKHPDLPIFDSPDWESELPSAQRPAKPPKAYERPRHGHVILNGKAKVKVKATKKILKRTRVIEVATDMPGEEEDVLPSTWAKADEGMYAKLIPDTEDNGLLLDENDEESFSHFMVDSSGKQIVGAVGG